MTTGETDLGRLIDTMQPRLRPEPLVFATVPHGEGLPQGIEPVMAFREEEGTTLILPEDEARTAGLEAGYRCRMITLAVHSSLEAVGFLAAVTTALAAAGISVNPVSAYHHDHLFVPANRAGEAMDVLWDLSSSRPRQDDRA